MLMRGIPNSKVVYADGTFAILGPTGIVEVPKQFVNEMETAGLDIVATSINLEDLPNLPTLLDTDLTLASRATVDYNVTFGQLRSSLHIYEPATNNLFIGLNSGLSNSGAGENVGVGRSALQDLTNGWDNVAVGVYAQANVTTGYDNVSVGSLSLEQLLTGSDNTALGSRALQLNLSSGNTAVGSAALGGNTTGSNNVAVGQAAMNANNTGSNNTALGYFAGRPIGATNNTTGSNNTFLGYNSGLSAGSAQLTQATAIGASARVSQSNSIILGSGESVGIGNTAPLAALHVGPLASSFIAPALSWVNTATKALITSITAGAAGLIVVHSVTASAATGIAAVAQTIGGSTQDEVIAFMTEANNAGATDATLIGARIYPNNTTAGGTAESYGLIVDPQSSGATNFNVYSGPSYASFGGTAQVAIFSGTNVFAALNPPSETPYVLNAVIQSNTLYDNTPVYGFIVDTHTAGTRGTVSGVRGEAYVNSTATTQYAVGLAGKAQHQAAGTTQNLISILAYSNERAVGTVTNNYGLFVQDQAAGTANWNIWSGPPSASFSTNAADNADGAANFFGTTTKVAGVVSVSESVDPYALGGYGYASGPNGDLAVGVEGVGGFLGAGLLGEAYGVTGYVYNWSTGTVTNAIGIQVDDNVSGAGIITNNYGLRVSDHSVGTNNWNIYSGPPSASFNAFVAANGWHAGPNAFLALNPTGGVGSATSHVTQTDSSAAFSAAGKFLSLLTGTPSNTELVGTYVEVVSLASVGVGNTLYAGQFYARNAGAATILDAAALYIYPVDNTGGGSVTDACGISIADQTAGTANNWAIKTGLGLVDIGDRTRTGAPLSSLSVYAQSISGTNTALLAVSKNRGDYGSAGTFMHENNAGVTWGIEVVTLSDLGCTDDGGSFFHGINTGGTLSSMGIVQIGVETRAGTITNAVGCWIYDAVMTGGTITNLYGLKMEDQVGGTNNWAIHTGLGKVYHGDTFQILGHSAFGPDALIDKLNGATQDALIVAEQENWASTLGFGLAVRTEFAPPSAASELRAADFVTLTKAGNNQAINTLYGLRNRVYHIGNGNLTTAYGGMDGIEIAGSGAVDTLIGFQTYATTAGAGTVTNLFGILVFDCGSYNGTVTNQYGIDIQAPSDGTLVTNLYGLRIGNQSGAVNNWAIKTGLGRVEFGDQVSAPSYVGGTITPTGMTLGSVYFAGVGGILAQDNANFFWDDTNNRLGIGTASPAERLSVIAPDISINQIGFGIVGQGKSALYRTDAVGLLVYSAISGTHKNISWFTDASTERMRLVGSNGNVLIGSTSDSGNRLQVAGGDIHIHGTTQPAVIFDPSDTVRSAQIAQISDILYVFEYGVASRWNVNLVTGNTTTSGSSYVANGTAAAPSQSFTNGTGSGAFLHTDNISLRLASGGIAGIQLAYDRVDLSAAGALTFLNNTIAAATAPDFYIKRYGAKLLSLTGDGTGVTAGQNGLIAGFYGAGDYGAIWASVVGTVTTTNYALAFNGSTTAVNVPTGGSVQLAINGSIKWQVDPSGHFLAGTDNTIDIGTSGAGRPRRVYSASAHVTAAGGAFFWEARSALASTADGLITISNNTGTDFSRLMFGGTTAAFPALKRSTSSLEVKLADDSAYAAIGTGGLYFGTGGGIYGVADGTFRLQDSTATLTSHLAVEAANVLALNNGVNAQALRIYNTSSGANYERGFIGYSVNSMHLLSENGGTGVNRHLIVGTQGVGNLYFRTNGADVWAISNAGHFIAASDNTYDIGASGATRPRNVHVAGTVLAANITLASQATISTSADGNILLTNNAGNNFGVLQFGGTTNAFPAWKRNGSSIEARLADDTAYTNIVGTAFYFGSFGRIHAPSDGVFNLADAAATSFSRLQFGGTTNAFPALKRSGVILEARLADDSNYADFYAANILSTGNLTISAGGGYNWSARSVLASPVDGQITLMNNAQTGFTRLNFGGVTNAFPALRRSSTSIEVVTADNSAWATLGVGYIIADNSISAKKYTVTNQTLTDGATVNWDTANGAVATLTLGGNRTMAAPTNLTVGNYLLHVIQDATGSRTITWNAVFKWASGIAPTLTTTAGARDVISCTSDGTNLYCSFVGDVK